MDSRSEEFIVRLVATIVEGQNSNGLIRWQGCLNHCIGSAFRYGYNRSRILRWPNHKLIPGEIAQSKNQDCDNRGIKFAPGLRGDGLTAIDIFFFLDTLGRELKCPGDQQRNEQTNQKHHEDGL